MRKSGRLRPQLALERNYRRRNILKEHALLELLLSHVFAQPESLGDLHFKLCGSLAHIRKLGNNYSHS